MKASLEGGRGGGPEVSRALACFISLLEAEMRIPDLLVQAENKPQQQVARQPHCGE